MTRATRGPAAALASYRDALQRAAHLLRRQGRVAQRRQLDERRRELPQEQQRRRRVAAVQLVAHVKRPGHERPQRQPALDPPERRRDHRSHLLLHELQSLVHPFIICARGQWQAVRQAGQAGSEGEGAVHTP